MDSLNLSICVVLYESIDITKRFHMELMASLANYADVEVLYYDNSSGDELAKWFTDRVCERVHYRRDPRNLGFSFANNQLILSARHDRLLLLNPDVFGFTSEFWAEVATLDTTRAARFARLLNEDGSFQDCVGEPAGFRRALCRRRRYETITAPTEIGMGIMAFMLTDKAVFAEVGLLDCDYALYAEDMDWCYRARRHSIALVYDPMLVLTHIGGASARNRWAARQTLRRKYLAERQFIDKHYRSIHWLGMRSLNALKRLLRGSYWLSHE